MRLGMAGHWLVVRQGLSRALSWEWATWHHDALGIPGSRPRACQKELYAN